MLGYLVHLPQGLRTGFAVRVRNIGLDLEKGDV